MRSGGTHLCKESSFKDATKRHGRTMMVVRDAMLAERRNSRASRGLPRKIGRGDYERERGGQRLRTFWRGQLFERGRKIH